MKESRPEPSAPNLGPARPGAGRGISVRGVVVSVLVLLIAAVCVRLGFWQLDRLEQRRANNAALREALALPPIELAGDALEAVARDPDRFRFRRVRVRGSYIAGDEVVLRGRSLEGRPGVHLLTPLRIAGSERVVLVNRGWAPSPDALTIDPRPLAEPGVREVEGLLQLFPAGARADRPLAREVEGVPVTSIQRMDTTFLGRRIDPPLLPAYVRQLPGAAAPDGIRRLPVPEMGEGPHLGYAVQWFSFAAIALGGLLVFIVRSRRAPS